METNKTKNTDLFLIDPRNIVVVDGFNVRRDFDLDELKEQIKAKGVLNPLTVIAFKDDEGNEKYKLVDGERRYRATMLAISEGADIPYVRAMKARKDASTEELYIQQRCVTRVRNLPNTSALSCSDVSKKNLDIAKLR